MSFLIKAIVLKAPLRASATIGDAHPHRSKEKPLSKVRRTDPRSAQISGPDGVSQRFHVSTYSGEPRPAIRARNLLSKDRCRPALGDEAQPLRPKMASVICSGSPAGARKRLARTRAGPDGPVVGPPGEFECKRPPADPGEEMGLSCPGKVGWRDIGDTPRVDGPSGQVAAVNEPPRQARPRDCRGRYTRSSPPHMAA